MKLKRTHISISLLVLILSLIVAGSLNQSFTRHFSLETPRTSAGEITIITPENKTYSAPISGYYPALYGFENDLNGAHPSDWTLYGSGGTVNVISDIGGHNKVLKFQDTSGTGYVAVEQDIGINRDTDGDTIEFWWRSTNSVNAFGVTLFNDGRTGYLTEVRIMGGNFTYFDGADWQDFIACNINQWYHNKIVIDFTNKEFDWSIDDVIEQTDIPFMNNSVVNLRSIYIGSSYSQSSYDNFIDALGYSWNPNYNVGDNLNEGLLLSFENTTNLDWQGHSLDGQANKTILGNTTIPMPADGLHNIQVFGNDSVGTMYESDMRYFTTNTLGPSITINTPSPNIFLGVVAPSFALTIPDGDLDDIWYSLDGGITTIPFTGLSGTIDQTEWNKIGNGTATLTFYANDTANNIGQAEVTVRKDIITPVINIIAPSTGVEFDYTPVFEISITEGNLDEFWYTVDDGAHNNTITELSGIINQNAWNLAPTGPITIRFYARDLAGNIGTTFVIVVKTSAQQQPPPEIPGYDLYVLIGALSLLSVLLIRKRVKS